MNWKIFFSVVFLVQLSLPAQSQLLVSKVQEWQTPPLLVAQSSRRAGGRRETFARDQKAEDEELTFIEEEVVRPRERKKKRRQKRPLRRRVKSRSSLALKDLENRIEDGEFEEASMELYAMSRSNRYAKSRMRVKYLLGRALLGLELNQAAAFQFVSIIREGRSRYVQGALSQLTTAANQLGDDTLITYAVSRMKDGRIPRRQQQLVNFRKGELHFKRKRYESAAKRFAKVRKGHPLYFKSKYKEALAYAKAKKESSALRAIRRLIGETDTLEATHPTRVTALMAKARIHYQKKEWDQAVESYRQIPRDSVFWHDTLFEQSWAYLMSAKFRSALSNFHTLHSPYYEKFYMPESLVLRAIVYLYICNYQELEKVIRLFERIYNPIQKELDEYLEQNPAPTDFFKDFEDYVSYWRGLKVQKTKYSGPIPEVMAGHLMKDGSLRKLFAYLSRLRSEQSLWEELSEEWQFASVGQYSQRLIERRLGKVVQRIGRRLKFLLWREKRVLQGFVEQSGFLRFEMISGQKEALKKRLSGALTTQKQIVEGEDRSFFIQNGYEYWPFKGEYWLDELGNYHFLGTQNCGQ